MAEQVKGKPHRFKKGQSGNPTGKPKLKGNPGSDLARDMEQAYSTPESPTDSPGVKSARKLALEDYPRFVATYAKLKESAVKQGPDVLAKEGRVATVASPPGENEARVGELIEKLLLEWERGDSA